MNEFRAFKKSLAEDPADDTRRLVFADWLDEQAPRFGDAGSRVRRFVEWRVSYWSGGPAYPPSDWLTYMWMVERLNWHERELRRLLPGRQIVLSQREIQLCKFDMLSVYAERGFTQSYTDSRTKTVRLTKPSANVNTSDLDRARNLLARAELHGYGLWPRPRLYRWRSVWADTFAGHVAMQILAAPRRPGRLAYFLYLCVMCLHWDYTARWADPDQTVMRFVNGVGVMQAIPQL